MAGVKFIAWLWLLTGVYCFQMEYRTFRCSNGTYINDKLICNGEKDCIGDDVDVEESFNFCGNNKCGPGSFRCRSRYSYFGDICLNATARCNTITDCRNFYDVGEDEINCGDEVNIAQCTLQMGKFLCDDRKKCLDLKYTCDRICNCFDCSDEKSDCLNDGYMDNSENRSNRACFETPNGPICCSEFDSLCQACNSDEICDQKCVQFVDKRVKCFCDEDYYGVPNTENSECNLRTDVAKESWLLFSNQKYIRGLNLLTNAEIYLPRSSDGKCTALTALDQYLYYATDRYDYVTYINYSYSNYQKNRYTISKLSRTSNKTDEITKSDEIVTSLSIDWITSNVYYTTPFSVTVCTNSGEICKKLKSEEIIHSVHLAPKFGLMFWISQQTQQTADRTLLKKSSMDGSDEKIIFDFDNSNCTRSRNSKILKVDELTERIFLYCPSSYELRSITLNGDVRAIWRFDSEFYDGAIFGRNIFYLESDKTKILSIDRKSKVVVTRVSIPKNDWLFTVDNTAENLHVYNPRLRRAKVQNPCPGSCTGLCLLRPSTDGVLKFTCVYNSDFPFALVAGIIFLAIVILTSVLIYFENRKRNFCGK